MIPDFAKFFLCLVDLCLTFSICLAFCILSSCSVNIVGYISIGGLCGVYVGVVRGAHRGWGVS